MSTLIPSLVVCGATCGFLIAFPLQWPIWVIIAISVAALFNAWLILFARKVKKENYFILDLPWWHIWPFAFVLATALPIGWIIYAISFAKMSRYVFLTYRREPKPRVGNPEIDERAEEVALEEAAQVASAELVAQCDQVLAEIAAREAEQAERQREIPTGTTTPNIPGAELVAKIAQTGQRIQQKRADKAAAKIINRSGEGSAPVINHSSDVEKAFALYEHLRSGDDRT
jgi:hypothetical protein